MNGRDGAGRGRPGTGRTGTNRLAERLRSAVRERPLEVPVESMWDAIVEERLTQVEPVERGRRWPWALGWGLAAAAVVVLALGIGRGLGPAPGGGPGGPHALPGTPVPTPVTGMPARYEQAAADLFREAEALLVLFRTGAGEPSAETGRWASSLLGTTRLLIDSPIHDERRFGEALDDLELVLVQLAGVDGGAAGDRRWVEASLESRQLMTKLRAVGSGVDEEVTTMEDLED